MALRTLATALSRPPGWSEWRSERTSSRRGSRSRGLATAGFAAVAIQGLGVLLAPVFLVFWVMVVCYLVGGAGHGVKNVAFRSLIDERIPADRHGRAFAAYNGLRNTAELLALVAGGLLVATLGARETLFLAGGVSGASGPCGPGRARAPRVQASATEHRGRFVRRQRRNVSIWILTAIYELDRLTEQISVYLEDDDEPGSRPDHAEPHPAGGGGARRRVRRQCSRRRRSSADISESTDLLGGCECHVPSSPCWRIGSPASG